ncbi:hypothetical protein J5N97_027635 [Dioscorea zingiberensis]|uniref:Morc S5 domain-containing protein n=1 Tax=Dioscorea zingiberensis TaxID=325984 RepID=A0A9D5BXG8_9LILI|nr:hypothetical protein J5N97_027635 [Dioscorea zingiberensis]
MIGFIEDHREACSLGFLVTAEGYEMNFPDVIDLCDDDDETEVKDIRGESTSKSGLIHEKARPIIAIHQPDFREYYIREGFAPDKSLDLLNGYLVADQLACSANEISPVSTLPVSAPLCRQFWVAGDYEPVPHLAPAYHNGQNRMRVHPKFLHTNATSHKWAFGAIAELLDNALDEVYNGATFVVVDKITNPQNGTPGLMIKDDGGGMDPESLRRCMSFGFSDKQLDSSIGQYGNGFKTSTMRLGADVVVFSRSMIRRTQSVGILSYTFLRQTGCEDVIVPVVDYQFDPVSGECERLDCHGQKKFCSNLSLLLRWSPYTTEVELLKQFDDIECHGTKIVIFNLWHNDDGVMELDFESDVKDLMISDAPKMLPSKSVSKIRKQKHVANRLWYSLRVYSSILYLHLPENFRIILRGQVVDPHHIVNDLKYREGIKYKPQIGGKMEAEINTIIGYLEGSPNIDVHGFNIYHKNRLILPFLPVVSTTNGRGKGVAGVLEANFIKPTHNKQDFERSTLYQRLVARLRDMTNEYWDFHCHLVGYQTKKEPSLPPSNHVPAYPMQHSVKSSWQVTAENFAPDHFQQLPGCVSSSKIRPHTEYPVSFASSSVVASAARDSQDPGENHFLTDCQIVTALSAPALPTLNGNDSLETKKRRLDGVTPKIKSFEKQAVINGMPNGPGSNCQTEDMRGRIQEFVTMMQANEKLRAECAEYERTGKELMLKEQDLRLELHRVQEDYNQLFMELQSMNYTGNGEAVVDPRFTSLFF